MIVNFKRLKENAIIPTFGHDDNSNAGLDFYAAIEYNFILIPPGNSINIDTGIAWEPNSGIEYLTGWKPAMIIKGRSSLSIKYGIECCNAGVVDQGYRGSITIRLYNAGEYPYMIKHGDRIAQGVVVLLPIIEVREVSELGESIRGERGFGSSGR